MSDELTSTDETGPVVLWPTKAIEGALADRDRLADIIDRAAERLREPDAHAIALDLGEMPREELEGHMVRALNAMLDARNILAEGEPGEPGE